MVANLEVFGTIWVALMPHVVCSPEGISSVGASVSSRSCESPDPGVAEICWQAKSWMECVSGAL